MKLQVIMKFLALLMILGVSVYVEASPYCEPTLCLTGTFHVGCNLDIFKLPCPVLLTQYVDLDPHISRILTIHNSVRNQVAGGQMGYTPAARMATMTWSNELAQVSKYNAQSCRGGNDQCRNTKNFRNSGQSQKVVGPFCESNYNNSRLVEEAIADFYNDANKRSFKLMVKENNINVGCSAVKYTNILMKIDGCSQAKYFYLVCNYATDTLGNGLEYITVDQNRTAQFCVTGTNPNFRYLCASAEKYLL